MFEHKTTPLLPIHRYVQRQLRFFLYSCVVIGFSITIGVLGYHFVAHLGWIDSLLNASMILTGMGPVGELPNNTAKLFASCYALFSGSSSSRS